MIVMFSSGEKSFFAPRSEIIFFTTPNTLASEQKENILFQQNILFFYEIQFFKGQKVNISKLPRLFFHNSDRELKF